MNSESVCLYRFDYALKRLLRNKANYRSIGRIFERVASYVADIDYLRRMFCGTSKVITEHTTQGLQYVEAKKVCSIKIWFYCLSRFLEVALTNYHV
ncbi:MAG: hypothetical protein LBT09_00040 [Planctomycetaceae bacterium]|jgi:hypothetical protein|nr:hypothetical protein [Planctomycetaceae bacterium]